MLCGLRPRQWILVALFLILILYVISYHGNYGIDSLFSSVPCTPSFAQKMHLRRERISKECSELLFEPFPQHEMSRPFVIEEEKLVWCPVYKAASSEWHRHLVNISRATKKYKSFLRGGNRKSKRPFNEIARKLYPAVALPEVKRLISKEGYKAFVYVRHPFRRLISAYRDKLEQTGSPDPSDHFYFKKYGSDIVSEFRESSLKRFGEAFFSKHHGSPLSPEPGKFRSRRMPTFWEFVQFVKKTEKNLRSPPPRSKKKPPPQHDVHWRPMTQLCSPCDMNYTYIVKLETAAEEEETLIRELGLEKWIKPQKTNSNSNRRLSEEALVKLYFEQLDEEDIAALKNIYELDFRIFGYKDL